MSRNEGQICGEDLEILIIFTEDGYNNQGCARFAEILTVFK